MVRQLTLILDTDLDGGKVQIFRENPSKRETRCARNWDSVMGPDLTPVRIPKILIFKVQEGCSTFIALKADPPDLN